MKTHNLNDFVKAIQGGEKRIAYNLNTGEMRTDFIVKRTENIIVRSSDMDSAVLKNRVAECIKSDPMHVMHDDAFIVFVDSIVGTTWSIATIHTYDGN